MNFTYSILAVSKITRYNNHYMPVLFCLVTMMLFAQPAQAQVSGDFVALPAQWQLTFDVIKAKAQALLIQNNELTQQQQVLKNQAQQLQQVIYKQQAVNYQSRQLLKERNGKTDQQIALEQLMVQLKAKRSELVLREAEWNTQKKSLAEVERKINLQKLKIAELQMQQDQREAQAKAKAEAPLVKEVAVEVPQLDGLRKQLEEAKAQEVALENQLAELKDNQQGSSLEANTLDEDNKVLTNRLEMLRQQKAQREKDAASAINTSALAKERYYKMTAQKALLEEKIRMFESKADALKQVILDSRLPWPTQKKKMIHDMVQADARNSQLREKIGNLREDIVILQDQIAKMERRINFMQDRNLKLK